jgi:dienelactone hydrolase
MLAPLINLILLLILSSCAYFKKGCDQMQKTLKDGDFEITLLTYKAQDSKKHIIIIPPTGGTNVLDRSYARNFCSEGFNVSILSHWSMDDEINYELSIHQKFYSRAQRSIGMILNDLPLEHKVGILGTSVGGLHAAIAISRFERISSAFVITAGAPIPAIIAHSNQEAMKKAWDKRQEMYGFKTKEEYIAALNKALELAPQSMKESNKRLGMVIATKDKTVPTRYQQELREMWQPQKLITYDHNHFFGIVFTWAFQRKEIINFFKKE